MALDTEYSDLDCKMMELAGAALVKASDNNDAALAVAIFAATPPQFRTDLRDFAIWLIELESQRRGTETLH